VKNATFLQFLALTRNTD